MFSSPRSSLNQTGDARALGFSARTGRLTLTYLFRQLSIPKRGVRVLRRKTPGYPELGVQFRMALIGTSEKYFLVATLPRPEIKVLFAPAFRLQEFNTFLAVFQFQTGGQKSPCPRSQLSTMSKGWFISPLPPPLEPLRSSSLYSES